MVDIVPYEGNGDANNHSETLNRTLLHAMLVRMHTFTAHRTHQEPRALQSTGFGCSTLTCPKTPLATGPGGPGPNSS